MSVQTAVDRSRRVAEIHAKIARMGHDYRPGNASRPGHLYNPLPFAEFGDVPVQREACAERLELIRSALPDPGAGAELLDLGCHTGYHCFELERDGWSCTGVELDPLSVEIARDVAELYSSGARFFRASIDEAAVERLGRFDAVLFLSTFQWVTQAIGFERARRVLLRVAERCDTLLFETSTGDEGKAKMPMLPDAAAVERLLRELGPHPYVECLGEIAAPCARLGKRRTLFRSRRLLPGRG